MIGDPLMRGTEAERESRARTDENVRRTSAVDQAEFEGWVTMVIVLGLAALIGWYL